MCICLGNPLNMTWIWNLEFNLSLFLLLNVIFFFFFKFQHNLTLVALLKPHPHHLQQEVGTSTGPVGFGLEVRWQWTLNCNDGAAVTLLGMHSNAEGEWWLELEIWLNLSQLACSDIRASLKFEFEIQIRVHSLWQMVISTMEVMGSSTLLQSNPIYCISPILAAFYCSQRGSFVINVFLVFDFINCPLISGVLYQCSFVSLT